MANPLHPSKLFPENQQVEDWYDVLQSIGHVPKYKGYISARDGTFMKRLYFCKQSKGLQHEFIVADLARPDGSIIHAIIDRCASDLRVNPSEIREQQTSHGRNDPETTGSAHTSTTSFASFAFLDAWTSSSEAVVDRFQKPSHANDRVRFFAGRFVPTPHTVIKHLDFDLAGKQGPSLVQLAIAAIVAHRYAKYYILFRHQCYWYADCICVLIEEIAGERNFTVTDKTSQRGRQQDEVTLGPERLREIRSSFSRIRSNVVDGEVLDVLDLDKEHWCQLQPGTYTFKIFTRKTEVVERMKRCLNQVTEEWNKEDGERLEVEAQRLREQEDRQKAERDKRIAERDKQMAEQTIEELNKKVEELERKLRLAHQSTSNEANQ